MQRALDALCEQARARNISLLIDGEQTAVQPGIDAWTLALQRRYNRETTMQEASDNGHRMEETAQNALVYGTYQAYLRSAPSVLSTHLHAAARDGFALGVKFVRGAYRASEPPGRVWPDKPATDRAYDGMAAALLRGEYRAPLYAPAAALRRSHGEPRPRFPAVALVLATHNRASARTAEALRRAQAREGKKRMVSVGYAQLMGMADHVTGELLGDAEDQGTAGAATGVEGGGAPEERPRVAKYVVWGSVGECTKYLVRRAEENRDAVERTGEATRALWWELRRRLFGMQSITRRPADHGIGDRRR